MSSDYVSVPSHPGLRVAVWTGASAETKPCLVWTGTPDDLIAAGVVTAERLQPLPDGKRRSRYNGWIDKHYGIKNGKPRALLRVFRRESLAALLPLPGAREALAYHEQRECEEDQRRSRLGLRTLEYAREPIVKQRPSYLRLVVSNA